MRWCRATSYKGGITMNFLYKTTLLITMAVVTWKVVKIEKTLKPKTLTNIVNKQNADVDSLFTF